MITIDTSINNIDVDASTWADAEDIDYLESQLYALQIKYYAASHNSNIALQIQSSISQLEAIISHKHDMNPSLRNTTPAIIL